MKLFTITNLITGIIFKTESEALPQNEPAWGLSERWVSESNCSPEDIVNALESRTINDITEHRLAAMYMIVETDITIQRVQQEVNDEARTYLASTDWYIIREAETGELCPANIKTTRATARASII